MTRQPHLLHLDASARRRSFSREVSAAFADAWREADGTVTHRDLAADPVPHLTEAWTEICDNLLADGITALDRLHEGARTPEQATAWQTIEPLLNELVAADVILIGTPMYNYGVPASLKAWIDQVTFPRMSLTGRRIVVASARGGSYLPGAPKAAFDHQARYLQDFAAGHFAIDDVTFLHAELANAVIDPHLADLRDRHEASLAEALKTARDLGRELATRTTT
ncbi:FMN-dependent NADH-azoreductase [Streptomyces xanthii]|uniref:FMN dependent NADH:quinone oxidoreductase n=1 Tax=Streptomyces xanthii TaxID=2768069 RepID=A0A7H1BKD0_9ACTN|nr:NAD(P)H-dependent oxidoreductase [Streptomyces xanthii]QNS09185.1 NAD(P)H-dependent oxidoreductase [Streptomyces xanthii]